MNEHEKHVPDLIRSEVPFCKKVINNYNIYDPEISGIDVGERSANSYYYSVNDRDIVNTTLGMGLVGNMIQIEHTYMTQNGNKINKVNLGGKVYYIYDGAFETQS